MGSLLTSRFFPVIATLVALAIGGGVWFGTEGLSESVAIGLAAFGAILAIRNWAVAEEDRPLLADELIGLHETVDALRADAAEMRAMMSELTSIVEDAMIDAADPKADADAGRRYDPKLESRGPAAPPRSVDPAIYDAIDNRIAALEATLADRRRVDRRDAVDDADADADAVAARIDAIEDRLASHDARAGMLAKAMRLTVDDARRNGVRLSALEADVERVAALEYGDAFDDESGFDTDHEDLDGDAERDPAPKSLAREAAHADAAAAVVRARRDATTQGFGDRFGARSTPTPRRRGRAGGRPMAEAVGVSGMTQRRTGEVPLIEATPQQPAIATPIDDLMAASSAQFEALLQPIVSLADQAPAFFEVFPNTDRSGSNSSAALFVQGVGALDRLTDDGDSAGVLCDGSLVELQSATLLESLLAYLAANQPLVDRLVLEFPQSEIDASALEEGAALSRLRDAGLRFSLDRISDLSVDLERLAAFGFRYVKLPASDVLRAVGDAESQERRLATFRRVGVELIADQIETTADIARLSEAGVRYGQGDAIASPRLVRFD